MTSVEIIEPGLQVTNESGCWPTSSQELVLRAALLHGRSALDAWQDWKSVADLDALDFGTHRMLPLVYHNLRAQGLSDPVLEKFRSVHRYYFYNNEVILHRGAALLKIFHQAGIPTMVLKGAALIPLYYKKHGLRPMQDFDVMVPPSEARKAVSILRAARWAPLGSTFPERLIPVRHSIPFKNPDGHLIDLHWTLLWECWTWSQAYPYWDRAIPLTIGDQHTLALDPTDQLLHILWHGARWNEVPPIRWIADALMVLSASEGEIDWHRLLASVQRHHLRLLVYDALEYLATKLEAGIPPFVFERLQAMPASELERFGYRLTIEPISAPTNNEILRTLRYEYHWLTSDVPGWRKPKLFLVWLLYKWGIKRPWKLPFVLLRNAIVRLSKQAKDLITGQMGSEWGSSRDDA